MQSGLLSPGILRWFNRAKRDQARLRAAQDLVTAAYLHLQDAADLLDAVRRDAEGRPGGGGGAEHRSQAQALYTAAQELRGIALPDF